MAFIRFHNLNVSANFELLLMTVFPKGSSKKEPVNYEKGRTEEELVDFLNTEAGTHRLVGGALSDSAGRIADLDALAQKLVTATNDGEEELVYVELIEVLTRFTSEYHFSSRKLLNC